MKDSPCFGVHFSILLKTNNIFCSATEVTHRHVKRHFSSYTTFPVETHGFIILSEQGKAFESGLYLK